MKSMTLDEIARGVGGKLCSSWTKIQITQVSTDSRKVKPGDLFLALRGDHFDGHDFIDKAVASGAAAVIAERKVLTNPTVPFILVSDTRQAFLDLAGVYRQKFDKPVIAVTGSVGKTSTKNMIAAVLSAKLKVHKTEANFNNEIGLPQTILRWSEDQDVMVLEMGMRGLGEIRLLAKTALPNIAVITNIGISHIERLGSKENILKAKMEIVEGMGPKGLLILNGNDPLLGNISQLYPEFKNNFAGRIITVAVEKPGDFTAYDLDQQEAGISFKVDIRGKTYSFHIEAVGEHHVSNGLLALACAMELGLSPEEARAGMAGFRPDMMRGALLELDGIKFINDTYNASPDSMQAALAVLNSLAQGKRSVAVLGNIFELGEMAVPGHFQVGQLCRKYNVGFTLIMGENAPDVAAGISDDKKCRIFDNHEEIVSFLKDYLKPDDVVLIKGSRGMEMERILTLWQK
ncbi:MAG: UDP-N-acetylmuramoyl-tripeptide--D-alanyl-D-alanine ligase [Dehalobacterium sp.]|jgi:UDP-N-acetylmuramoyl-tripeptide--D-alanyl-D-alanine ligase